MLKIKNPKIVIYQTYYNDTSKARLDGRFKSYYNENCDKYMESSIIQNLASNNLIKGDYFGVVSSKISFKIDRWDYTNLIKEIKKSKYDFYYVGGGANHENVWLQANRVHKTDFAKWANFIFKEIGFDIDVLKLNTPLSFCNYHIAKSDLYLEWVNSCLNPCIDVMNNPSNKGLQNWLNNNSTYSGIRPKECLKIFGRPYYTRHPFIAERLFPTYAAYKQWSGHKMFSLKSGII